MRLTAFGHGTEPEFNCVVVAAEWIVNLAVSNGVGGVNQRAIACAAA